MKRRIILIVIVAIVVVGGAAFGIDYFIQQSNYVTTDNAEISAPLDSVSAIAPGQIIKLNVNVGDRVTRQETLAEVGTPQYSDPGARQGLSATPGSGTAIESPVSGYVAAVWSYPGALVSAGSPIVTLYDDSNVWVTANIDETKIDRINPGQAVDITVDSLGGAVLKGKVQAISPATAGSFSLLPQSNTSANFTKVAQVVPVIISLDNTVGATLIPGSSVEVKIKTK